MSAAAGSIATQPRAPARADFSSSNRKIDKYVSGRLGLTKDTHSTLFTYLSIKYLHMQILEGGYNSDNSGTISRRQNRKHVSSFLLSLEQTYSHNLVILSGTVLYMQILEGGYNSDNSRKK